MEATDQMKVNVYTNGDDAYLVWKTANPIPSCRGFAVYRQLDRRNESRTEDILHTWVGFEGETAKPGTTRPSTEWPIQKFMWTDYTVRRGDTVSYRIVPMVGPNKNSLTPARELASDWTSPVKISPYTNGASAYFNRGIVAAQWLSRRLEEESGSSPSKKLRRIIDDVNDKTRRFLAGEIRIRILQLLEKTRKSGGRAYAALFELDDPELISALKALGNRANVVLGNGSARKKSADPNADAREALQRAHVNVYDRMTAPSRLAHNKFLVLCDSTDHPQRVWTGSTNWTKTGLCTQANNGILFYDKKIASYFKNQWERLKNARSTFPNSLKQANSTPKSTTLTDSKFRAWFTPTKSYQDLKNGEALIRSARQGILFLMFNPGPRETLLNAIIDRTTEGTDYYDPDLYVHGVLNQDPSTEKNPVRLFHRGKPENAPFDIVLPAAINRQLAYWVKELKKLPKTFAMVHSKVIVIDPFGNHPVVMTGSHNLGPKASHINDENLVIVENDSKLAASYSVNIMSIYNQYRWRFRQLTSPKAGNYHGSHDNDTWQDWYFKGPQLRELNFWLGRSSASWRNNGR